MTDENPNPPRAHRSPLEWFRNSFAAGVAVVLPFAVTFWLVWTVVTFIDRHVVPLLPRPWRVYAEAIPGIGVVIAVIGLTLLGALAANLIGGAIVHWGERLVEKLPLVRTVYGGSKQIFKQVAAPDRQSFKEAVLVEFPHEGVWAIGFITSEQPMLAGLSADTVAIYVPHVPVPASGFLLYAPRSRLKPLGVPPEEALKRVISLGLIKDETKTLAGP